METNISPLGTGMGVLAARAQAEVDREALAPSIEISALGISTHGILSPKDLLSIGCSAIGISLSMGCSALGISIHRMLSPMQQHMSVQGVGMLRLL